jgi:hypothetical protein
MKTTATHWVGRSLVIAAAALLAACGDDAPVGLDRSLTPPSVSAARALDLGNCSKLAAPADTKLAYHVYAKGVQIYRWTGTSWGLYGPAALLSSDAAGKSVVGTHYEGPTWETKSGSKVVGSVLDRCTADPNAAAWLLLAAVPDEGKGPGVFHGVTRIQRVNTVGGVAPSTPGAFVGDEARIPYTTEYFFYRPK